MKRLIQFNMEDGGNIAVEINEVEGNVMSRGVRRPGAIAEEAKETFEEALSKIRPATEKVVTALQDIATRPDEIEMEFGFNLHAIAGLVIASTSDDANYKVTLRWKQTTQELVRPR